VVVGIGTVFRVMVKCNPNVFSFNCDEFNSCFSCRRWELDVIAGVCAGERSCGPPMLKLC